MKKILAFTLVLLIASTGYAAISDRLQPIVPGNINIAVDTFIIGTQDRYVATIVRDVDDEIVKDLTMTMNDVLNIYDKKNLAIVERRIFDKNSKKISLVDRKLTLKTDLMMPIASEPLLQSELEEVVPGSAEELIWNGVAGPDGWGAKILGDYPKPVLLSEDKWPVDAERYIPVTLNEVGGLFIDRESIEASEYGCTATAVQAFHSDGELQMGGMVMQYAQQPYIDALYAVSTSDYSFTKKAVRQTRYTIFGPNDKIIYSVKIAGPFWEDIDMNPTTFPSLGALGENLPENLYAVMSADVKEYLEFARKKLDEMKEMYEQEQEESPDR
jgi:hypothetical protein